MEKAIYSPPEAPSLDRAAVPGKGQIGAYLLLGPIGKGGMGAVYLARHQHLERVVALKIIAPHREGDAGASARFKREMASIGRLDHPNIVRATDAGEVDGQLFLVMDFIDGADLGKVLKQHGRLSAANAAEVVRQAALGLECIAQHHLVHRDLKPSNLLINRQGIVKIADLGLARYCGESTLTKNWTASDRVHGTPDYMAPEQAYAGARVDIRCDIYSLGCTLYALLTGRPPFASESTFFEKVSAHCHKPVPPLMTHDEQVPDALLDLLKRLLAKDADDRPASPAALASELEPLAAKARLDELLTATVEENQPRPRPTDTDPQEQSTRAESSNPKPGYLSQRKRSVAVMAILMVIVAAVLAWSLKDSLFGVRRPQTDPHNPSASIGPIGADVPRGKSDAGRIPPKPAGNPLDLNVNQPLSMAGLPDLDACVPGEWYDLLTVKPKDVIWKPVDKATQRDFDLRTQQFTVHSTQPSLFQFGSTNRGNYSFSVYIQQSQLAPNVGVFWGLQWKKPPGQARARERDVGSFHLLAFGLRDRKSGKIRLSRFRAEVYLDDNGERCLNLVEIGRVNCSSAISNRTLSIAVKNFTLHDVRLDGLPLTELVDAPEPPRTQHQDHSGAIGAFSSANASVFGKAHFRTLSP